MVDSVFGLEHSAYFRWYANDPSGLVVMGESFAFSNETRLPALSPLPCRFTLVKDGNLVHQAEGRAVDWTPSGPGKYRVEAELKVGDEWVTWVYANPVQLQ